MKSEQEIRDRIAEFTRQYDAGVYDWDHWFQAVKQLYWVLGEGVPWS